MNRILQRHEIPKEFTWDLESVYATPDECEQDIALIESWIPKLEAFRGTLGHSPSQLLACLQLRDLCGVFAEMNYGAVLDRLMAYARQRRDEDTRNSAAQALFDRCSLLASRLQGAQAFIEPEILALSEGVLGRFRVEEPALAPYDHYFANLLRQKSHVLPAREEQLLADAAPMAGAPSRIFTALTGPEMNYPVIRDSKGEEYKLTRATYRTLMQHPDREVRRETYEGYFASYRRHVRTLTAVLNLKVQQDWFHAKARHYSSALEAALCTSNIPNQVFHNLISEVNRHLPLLHRYLALRGQLLGVQEMQMYDLLAPISHEEARRIPYEEATELITTALEPLGPEYVGALRKGLRSRWVDVYPTEGKLGGIAYSWGAYGTHPFVLFNYQGTLSNVFVLGHELGHSMHSYFKWRHQPSIYAQFNTFTAEVASTMNEVLLTHHLLRETREPQMRTHVLLHALENFRQLLFNVTMETEFEWAVHHQAEEGNPLTPDGLCTRYAELSAGYCGPGVVPGEYAGLGWARSSSLFDDFATFYQYQYATGTAAAVALAHNVLTNGEPAVDAYLQFLKNGSSDYPVNLLRAAGVDMTTPAPVEQGMGFFASLLDDLEATVKVLPSTDVG